MERKLKTEVKPYKHSEILAIFKRSKSNINRALKEHRKRLGPRKGYTWSKEQVKIIFEILGHPYIIINELKDPTEYETE